MALVFPSGVSTTPHNFATRLQMQWLRLWWTDNHLLVTSEPTTLTTAESVVRKNSIRVARFCFETPSMYIAARYLEEKFSAINFKNSQISGYKKSYVDIRTFRMLKPPDVKGQKNVCGHPDISDEISRSSPLNAKTSRDVKGQKIVCRHPEVCWFCSRYPEISDEISRCPGSKKCIIRSGSFVLFHRFFWYPLS